METRTSHRLGLLKIRGFLPYLTVVLVNAMLDLGHKIIIQNTVFKCYDGSTQIALTALVNACILLPFIMFFTPAGFLADRFSKHRVMRWTAGLAIPMTVLIYGSYLLGWFEAAFVLTLILAAQSAFYSPAKYGYIKEMAGKDNLGMANGVVQAVTIVAILLGGVLFSLLFESLIGDATTKEDILHAIAPSGLLLIAGAVAQTLVALRIPQYKPGDTTLHLDFKTYVRGVYLKKNLKNIYGHETIWLCVLGLSLFWGVNQVLFAAFGAHLKDFAGVTSTVVAQGLLAIGGVGIIVGSITAGRLSRTYIETGIIPLAALGMTICLATIPGMSNIPALGCLLAVYGFFGGLYVVPLNALIQFNAKDSDLGTILAGNNFLQNVFMLAFLCMTVLASLTGLSSVPIILTLAAIMALGSVHTLRKLPQSFMRFLLRIVFAQRYRLVVTGLKNIPSQGGVLLLGNHTSWIDWAVLHLAVPRPVRFVMSRHYYSRWYLRWFLDLYRVIPISSAASSSALRTITENLKAGECVVLFPEGAISRNGQLAAFRRGYCIPAVQSECTIVPFYLRGLWGSRWSAVSRHFRRNTNGVLARDVNLCFGPALPATATPQEVKDAVHRQSIMAWQEFARTQTSIPQRWLRAVKRAPARLAVADSGGAQATGEELFLSALALSRTLSALPEKAVGILLPPGVSGAAANMAVLMAGKTTVNLDPGLSAPAFASCLQQAGIGTILSTRKHLEKLRGQGCAGLHDELRFQFVEDCRTSLRDTALTRLLIRLLPVALLRFVLPLRVSAQSTAAIVFVPRQEPMPVGVCLGHSSIITNARQIASLFPPRGDDVLLTALPLHDALGLTTTMFLPLLESVPMACAHDPFEARRMGRLCVDFEATMLCADPAMLEAYIVSPALHPLMFASLRSVLSGGLALSDYCVQAFRQKFGLIVHDGYGTTETTPVATVNAPDVLNPLDLNIQQGRKPGTVGLPLPGSALRIVHPQTLTDLPHGESGRILIGGTQVMQGYLGRDDLTAKAIVEADGIRWFITQDTGRLDEDGFLILEIGPKRS
ncbi:MFS transporter [Desulfomicrobium baculatum]|uniref:AMP-dependent synthetase and ligase n=1 Tax=Desulfomicrobium baculatum (strain DSM 4028 / VKM B-1378 / X) TaxID=525897 RepID=C7LTV1_DESBD|nr:MFS transporter [Desulfomicrobium baculatum]ACU89574.1 AMP-dependent synthetase and ligase [Desulfomicrobium baculatum DSM 4028]